jgi:hypothetical protein
MIKVHKNDSIVDIIIKIKNNKEKEIILEFPFGHPILHNYTSLRILKTKAEKRDLIIITNDITAKKIWRKLWIKYSITDNPDLVEYNYSFFEYFIYTFKNYFREIKDVFLHKNSDNIIWRYREKYSSSKIWYFISFLFISILLLIFIFYFAVNITYITITPEIEVKTKWKNFTFTEMAEDQIVLDENTIKLRKISKLINLTSTFWASGVSNETVANARWKVTLFNHFSDPIDLIANTRLQTGSWVVFLIEWSVSIPWSSVSWSWEVIPWKIDAFAVSRLNDIDWNITWNKWNISEWTEMFLPWLKDSREKIYAIAISNFSGWNDNYKKIILKQDVENAKKILRWQLENEAMKELRADILESNMRNNVEYEIFWLDWITQYTNFEIFWENNIKIWEEAESFELWWAIRITTYTYNKPLLLNKMRQTINNSLLVDIEEVLEVNSNSLRIISPVLSRQERPFSVKTTAIVEVLYVHNFLNQSNSYINRFKWIIRWLDKDEAEKIILNSNKVSNVEIKIRPFFINKVSKINENIIFKIKETK